MFNQDQSILSIKGVGEKIATPFFKKNINTIDDLITYLPISYIHYRPNELIDNSNVSVNGTVISELKEYRPRRTLTVTNFQISNGEFNIKVVAWNMPYLSKVYSLGNQVEILGKYDQSKNTITLKKITKIEDKLNEDDKLIAVYSKINNQSNYKINKLVNLGIEQANISTNDRQMLTELHNPTSFNNLKQASQQFKRIEFSAYYLKIKSLQKNALPNDNYCLKVSESQLETWIEELPFTLTDAQLRAVRLGVDSLEKDIPMQALILGDVGAGKTVVSLLYVQIANINQRQSTFLLPTEILANQVYQVVTTLFPHIKAELLTSATKKSSKKLIKSLVETGSCKLLIGTHAILEEDVVFKDLSLVIIDEQHRFGVNQRQTLVTKGKYVNYCYLSATPIPRTIAHTLYGVLDIIEINQKPKDRLPIKTKVYSPNQKNKMLSLIEDQLANGHQVFIITPLAYEVEDMNLADSYTIFKNFSKKYEGKYQVGMINGQINSEQKNKIMRLFANKHYDILVATTVVEVGVDIPGASAIVILNAERFGLATLHQLRGRVGRNNIQSYCLLLDESSNSESKQRLKLMEEIDNGSELALRDYQMRGMGELTGVRQSGSENFILFNLQNDQDIAQTVIDELSIIED